jgi:hypothetical protein
VIFLVGEACVRSVHRGAGLLAIALSLAEAEIEARGGSQVGQSPRLGGWGCFAFCCSSWAAFEGGKQFEGSRGLALVGSHDLEILRLGVGLRDV